MSSSTMKTCWNDLTIRDLVRIREIDELQLATEDEKNMKVAALLNDMSYEDIMQIPLSQVRKMIDGAAFLINSKPQPIKARKKYEVNGRTYKLLKNEVEMTVSQFIDFQAIYSVGFDKMPGELLAVMMVPVGHEYNDGYDKELVIEDMYDLGLEEGLGVCDFFTSKFTKSIRFMTVYLKIWMRIRRMLAPKKEKEMMKVLEIQMRLILDQLNSTYGLIV